MEPIYKKFMTQTYGADGVVSAVDFHYPDNFNFAFDVVDELARRSPDKPAMIWLSKDKEKRVFTFADVSRDSARAANYFRSLGIRKGDVVLLVLKRHYQFWSAMMGLCKLGAIAVPATYQLTKKDLVYRFNRAGIKAVVCTGEGDVAAAADEALAECPTVQLRMMVNGRRDGWLDYDAGLAAQSDVFPRPAGADATAAEDIMLMYFTSGTTSYPKIAAHTFTYAVGHIMTGAEWHNCQPGGLHFTIAETGWGKAVWGKLYGQWMCESTVFVYDFDRFHADDMLQVMQDNKITSFCAPPTMYRFFIHEDFEKYDLSSIRYATTAGEALNPEVYNRFLAATGLRIMEGFGQTETTLTVFNPVGSQNRVGSMGRPSPQYDIELLDDDDQPVEPGVVGEICISTKNGKPVGMFREYYNDPAATAAAWHDGYYHTGDTAWRDEDGYLWFVGRKDDLIKSSGYRISPFEIESVIMEHPSVLECAVTGIPDELRGQLVKATIVLARGYEPSDALKKEIQDYVKHLTAPYKYPRAIEFVEELPKTISGKIRHNVIRAQDIDKVNKENEHA
ncbi:MAG: AMP-binding protein [Oscillospiraceae bacterium]|nr:AMP-binding protein [Oscillospiraceae bacterium]